MLNKKNVENKVEMWKINDLIGLIYLKMIIKAKKIRE
jgi:hypothetical protein